ncbi:uncharacterized protein [Typha angustifolia]|uniref:uncharacterized protein isoform X1 n=1 Tax=Typha angustifolia TaxID=59011 RepID=UPI003C2FD0E1
MRQLTHPVQIPTADLQSNEIGNCKNQCKPLGSELLPKGIVSQTSNLEMQPLWGSPERTDKANPSKSLLAIPVGIKQKEVVDKIVSKFPLTEFTIMLFHYDGAVDEWRDLEWANSALHISAINQTKWWFAKRFLHPDIVAEYDYIFLWDEDLGVENFHPAKYLSIVKREGLEISQPALDTEKSQIHHGITARWKKGEVHRRFYKSNGGGRCNENSTAPPCTGWVEMMAPVFSKSSWRCVWHMIQNDLIYGWGMDYKFGYCAQGDRSLNVGVVDSEYIVHKGIPSLGGLNESKAQHGSPVSKDGDRFAVRMTKVRQRSFAEWKIFDKRWQNAAADDKCWTDRYPAPEKPSWHSRFNLFHLISFSAPVSQSQTNSQTKAPEHST